MADHPLLGPALLLSLVTATTSLHRYNEPRAGLLFSALVSLPFTLSSLVTRVCGLALLLATLPPDWAGLLLLSLALALAGVGGLVAPAPDSARRPASLGSPPACLASSRCSLLLCRLPALTLRGAASLLAPLDYTAASPVRGAATILLNYTVSWAGLGAGLAVSVLHFVPNTYHGLQLPSPGDFSLAIPQQEIKSGSPH